MKSVGVPSRFYILASVFSILDSTFSIPYFASPLIFAIFSSNSTSRAAENWLKIS